MPRRLSVLFALAVGFALLAGATSPAAAQANGGARSGRWAHEGAKVEPDPRAVWGRLDNGFRYVLLPHAGVPGRVVLQFVVLAGSLDERPDELGMAHYLEHLAFGGSRDFLPGQMVLLFQRLGIEYGSDVNAHTTFDHTAYRLEYRANDPVLLRDGLRLFRGFADGLTLDPQIIERERRVVLAELRLRNTMSGRQGEASLPVVFRGLRFPERMPGGRADQIAAFTRDQFVAFYQRLYRPDLMVLIGAGDLDAPALEAMVREAFSSIAKPTTPPPARDEGRLNARGLRAGVVSLPGVGAAASEVASVLPPVAAPDSREAQVEEQQREFVMRVFAERLRAQIPGGPDASYGVMLGHGVANASLAVPPNAWSHGVLALDELIRATLEKGLDPTDFEKARRNELRLVAHLREQLSRADPAAHAEALLESVVSHRVFVGLERDSEWRQAWLQTFTLDQANQVFRRLWPLNTMAFHVAGGVGVEVTPDKLLSEVQKYRRGRLTYLPPRLPRETVAFRLPEWGPPGTLAERRELGAFDARLWRFANEVRVNFVPSRQEPGIVRVVVRVGNGVLEMPGNRPALKEFGLSTLLASGTASFRPDHIRDVVDQRFLSFDFDVADRDAFAFRGTLASDELETFLGIVADFLHAPRFSSVAHQEQRMSAAMGRMAGSTGIGDGFRALNDRLFRGDARFTSGSPLDYISMSVVDVRRWMEAPLTQGYVEATIVGDLGDADAERIVARTLGALRPRAASKTTAAPLKPAVISARPGFARIEFTGEQNTGLVIGTWPTSEMRQVRDQVALEVLAKLLEIRVRTEVRERLGLAYSPSAELAPYDGFPGLALLQTIIDCAPADTEQVGRLVETIGAEIAANGIDEGEFIGARGILKSQLQRAFRDNGFLVNLLVRAQERPEEAQDIVALGANLIDGVTPDEVNRWARAMLGRDNCRIAAIVPKAFIGTFETAPVR